MRIENDIAEAFKTKAMEITSPEELDARIAGLYEKQVKREREMTMGSKKKRMILFALAGLIVLMITGFTVQNMIKMGDERISLEYVASANLNYDPAIGSIVRGQLQHIKDQLEAGESAYVYSNEIGGLRPSLGDLPFAEYVSNPYIFKDYEEWQAKLNEKNPDYKLPMTAQGSLAFVGGKEEYPFGGMIDQPEIVRQLEEEVKISGKDLAWKKIIRDKEKFPVFTSVYKDMNQEEVTVTMEVFTERVKKAGISEDSHESVTINGEQADYSVSEKFLYSDTNRYQSLIWVDTLEEMSIVYSIGSSGEHMTKDKLISIGESMK